MPKTIHLKVNGKQHTVDTEPGTMLLYVLRDQLGLHGPKFGCGLSECGACTIHLDGAAVRSCVLPVTAAEGRAITTLEGLGSVDKPGPLQQAFIDEQAVQCGYCINGMIMTAQAFLDSHPNPSRDDIKQALNGNLCRCGTHMRIVRAIERAAKNWRKAS
ncbi:MAG: (2Fe-2S)-binding protein [Rhodanobacteraceae bacterium]|nr:MAG: (2Fe-2S)-binding protein [Rhodanobacteraceae bacterium]